MCSFTCTLSIYGALLSGGHDGVGMMGWDDGTELLSVPARGVEGLWAVCATHVISQHWALFYR